MNFEDLFKNVPESLVVITPDYKIITATDQYLTVTMRKREELAGLHFLKEAFPEPGIPYENNPVKHALDEAKRTLKPVTLPVIKYDIAKPEPGQYDTRYWETTHTPVLNEKGEVAYLIQTARDVTEREIARLSLEDSEMRFRFIADSLPQLIDTNDANGDLVYFNKRWTEYTGLTEEELLQEPWDKIIHPADLEKVTQSWNKAFEQGTAIQVEMRLRDKQGNYRWFLNRYLPMHDASGNINLWLCSLTDIHYTKQMVEELLATNTQMALLSDQVEQAYKKAEAERKILIRLIDKAPAFFCILNGPEHRFVQVNQKYQQLFPDRQLLNKTVSQALPEITEQGFIEVLDNVYKSQKEFIANEILVRFARSEKGPIEDNYLTFTYQPILDENDKETVGILVSGFDVTELVRLRQSLTGSETENSSRH